MELQISDLEEQIYEYVDQIKELLSPETWQNVLLDCSKNEILVLWLLYRTKEVNMTQIAEYIHVPLNTATGVVDRMEKKKLIVRSRSAEDKRVVTICMGAKGMEQIKEIVGEMTYYGTQVLQQFTSEEVRLMGKFMETVVQVMKQERKNEKSGKKIRKITIE